MGPVLTVAIRDAHRKDETVWRSLWNAYCSFYKIEIAEEITTATWRRGLDPASPIFIRLAEQKGSIKGFAVCVLHEGTWAIEPVCYLEDIYVAHNARGNGLGRALIDDLITLGKKNGWSRLYWHTQASNTTARRLYDHYAPADDYVRYRLTLR
jgi:GNAT superfamily N-acetyltransferase